ncbi:efflux RND transporter periplasmic adaptor subunit [Methylobrevis albus]|uniref:efflux RND transporter periplasmic adaptor subunit n=1 Tax=Methylobrevis albus TaxID=2793297 RepID=UPI002E2817A3|nr:efflux RND transporter periplasmic adaptor subunit [Methylobrevis albus]
MTVAPDPVVRVQAAHFVSIAETGLYAGTVRPRSEVATGFRVGGKLIERPLDVGDVVAPGDLIARLDPDDLRLSLESAGAELDAARANLAQAEADGARYATLADRGHASKATDEQRRLATDEARGRLLRAERSVELAQNQLGYAEIRATFAAVVTAVSAEPGQVVSLGQPVVTLAPTTDKEVEIAVPESRVAQLAAGSAMARLWADGRSFPAKLREVSPQADAATRTYRARFTLPDADDSVRFGMSATIELLNGDPTPVVRLPATAVLDEGEGPRVFVIDPSGSKLAKTAVEVRRFGTDTVLISAGLANGDEVVTLGVNKLEDGQKVRVAIVEARR